MVVVDLKLTPKQKKFCEYYLQIGNATESARKAGYSEKTAKQIATENLAKPSVKQYIAERQAKIDEELIAKADEVMKFYSDVMRGNVKDQFGLEASLSDRLKAGTELMKRYSVANSEDNNERVIINIDV